MFGLASRPQVPSHTCHPGCAPTLRVYGMIVTIVKVPSIDPISKSILGLLAYLSVPFVCFHNQSIIPSHIFFQICYLTSLQG